MDVAQQLNGRRIGLLTSSASRLGGGVAEAVIAQAKMIRMMGGEAEIFALRDEFSDEDAIRYAPSQTHFFPISGPAQIGYAPQLLDALLGAKIDCLHQQGIWMYPSRAGERWAKQTGKPWIVTPQGMLDPWITARGRWKKALARFGYERASWRRAAFMHALTQHEAGSIQHEAGRSDSLVLPNAGPPAGPERETMPGPTITFIGRIHPKKNVLSLVAAWKLLDPKTAKLVIAGWGADHDVAELKAALVDAPASAQFIGPIFGEAKQYLLESSRFTILPTHSEGLPLAILESFAASIPPIMSAECNIPEGFSAGAAIECGYDPAAIAQAIDQGLAMGESEWLAMAKNARGLAQGIFSLEQVGARWAAAYNAAIARTAG